MAEETPKKRSQILTGICLGLSLLAAVGIAFSRGTAAETDYAVVNVVTALLGLLAWTTLVIGLQRSSLPRGIWRCVLLLPILLVAGFFTMNKVKRFNGELVPQFESRWGGSDVQWEAREKEAIPVDLLEPAERGFSQFRGSERDGVVDGVQLQSDWESEPPTINYKRPIGSGWSGFAVQGGVAITLEQRDQEEWVTAYNVGTGDLLWHYSMEGVHQHVMGGIGPRSTPTIWEDKVYVVSAVDKLVCLELATGSEIWSVNLLDGAQADFEELVTWGRSGSAVVDQGRVIVPVGGVSDDRATLIALDANTGDELLRFGDYQISYSSPVIAVLDGIKQLIYTSEENLSGFSLEDGEMLWTVPAPGSSAGQANVAQPIVVNSNQVLITKGYGLGGRLWRVARATDGAWKTEKIWEKSSVLKTKFTSAVIRGDHAYALSDGILECVEIATGKRIWKRGRYRQGQVLLVGEHLVVTSEGGEVVLVQATPEQFNELGRKRVIGDVTWNTAAMVGDILLMRNSDEMASVRLPAILSDSGATDETQIQRETL
ncbi:MAG: PQQ-binding-like beta-propeller repeat protein [Aureliella sp.]